MAAVSGYTEAHAAILQSLIARGSMGQADSIKVVSAAILHYTGDPDTVADPRVVSQYIDKINQAINPLDFQIRRMKDQQTEELIYAFVNVTSDAFTQLATSFSPSQIAYFRLLLDQIFIVNNTPLREAMSFKSMQAIRLVTGSHARLGLSAREAEESLDELVNQGWLKRYPSGSLALSTRALLELESYLVATYNEGLDPGAKLHIKYCYGCKQLLTEGERCENLDCGVRLHSACAARLFDSARSAAAKCPLCQTAWTLGGTPVGERALSD